MRLLLGCRKGSQALVSNKSEQNLVAVAILHRPPSETHFNFKFAEPQICRNFKTIVAEMSVMNERDFVRFEFKISFAKTNLTVISNWF